MWIYIKILVEVYMQFTAKAKYIHFSPYKLRPLADVVRGKNVQYALSWLTTCALRRAQPIKKALESAMANAKNLHNINADKLIISQIIVDEGPALHYFKPGAMGRSNGYKKRQSHISIVLKPLEAHKAKETKEA
jgi:large subunit ribosomal protein L22